jgi:hypothetical protein
VVSAQNGNHQKNKYYTLYYEEYKSLKNHDSIECYNLELQNSPIVSLSEKFKIYNRLNLTHSKKLKKLPRDLECNQLILTNCTSLTELPHGLRVRALIISGCTGLRNLPPDMIVEDMEFVANGCNNLQHLDGIFQNLTRMDLRSCILLRTIPDGIEVNRWVDIGNTHVRDLPESLKHVSFRWNGITIDTKTAFYPDTLTAQDVLNERNLEIRRAKMMRMGYDRFLELANPEVMDEDEDPGGNRQLLKIFIPQDEDLVALSVSCPSTGRKYVIRVPPRTQTCHQAAAWIAGFDNPDDYKPVYET